VSQDLTTETSPATEQNQSAAEPAARPATLLRSIIETCLLTAIIFLAVNFLIGRFQIQQVSMQPTLFEGERVIVDKISYSLHPPERGDIIVFSGHGTLDLIKRIIGLPGETIEVHDNQVFINGQALTEPYLTQPTSGNLPAQQIAPDRYFVMGDNRSNSQDSRSFGPIQISNIVGRAWIIYWPPVNWSVMPHYTYAIAQAP
jgi:signal peptidase I